MNTTDQTPLNQTMRAMLPKQVRGGFQPTILQIIPHLGAGGAEQGCIDVSKAIVAAGGKSIIVSNGGSRIRELKRHGATHITMPAHTKNPLKMWRNISRLKKIIRDHNVHIIHARSRAPAWSAYRAAKSMNIPFVTTCHAAYKFKKPIKRWYNSVMAKGDRVISISDFIGTYLNENYQTPPDKIRVAYRGTDFKKFHPQAVTQERMIAISSTWRIKDGAPLIFMPGRLSPIKGHHFLIEAIEHLLKDPAFKDAICVFAGSDQGRTAYRQNLLDTIKEKNLEGHIWFVPNCTDMPAAYMLSNAVVCASMVPEGFGRVPVEAQAMGRPAIATSHGGAGQTIIDRETGWLVEAGNVDELVDALKQALSLTDQQRNGLAMTSMQHVQQKFSVEAMCDAVINTYNELL